MPDLEEHEHDWEDANAKDDLLAYQSGFLEECAEAVAAGFEPSDEDPQLMNPEEDGEEAFNAMWEEVARAALNG